MMFTLSDNAIYDIYKDNEGGIWIGLFRRIDYYPLQFTNFDKYYPLSNKNSLSGKLSVNSAKIIMGIYG